MSISDAQPLRPMKDDRAGLALALWDYTVRLSMSGTRRGKRMNIPEWLEVSEEVRGALRAGKAVVALESTLIAHGLPWPVNQETAEAAEDAVREEGAMPATIAVWHGRPTVGLSREQILELARLPDVLKASRRDLANAVVHHRTAATTVAAT